MARGPEGLLLDGCVKQKGWQGGGKRVLAVSTALTQARRCVVSYKLGSYG